MADFFSSRKVWRADVHPWRRRLWKTEGCIIVREMRISFWESPLLGHKTSGRFKLSWAYVSHGGQWGRMTQKFFRKPSLFVERWLTKSYNWGTFSIFRIGICNNLIAHGNFKFEMISQKLSIHVSFSLLHVPFFLLIDGVMPRRPRHLSPSNFFWFANKTFSCWKSVWRNCNTK